MFPAVLFNVFLFVWLMKMRMRMIRAAFSSNLLPSRLIDDFVDGGFLVAGARHDVFVIGGNVTAQHRR